MKVVFKSLIALCLLIPFKGLSQQTTATTPKSTYKLELISPLDIHFKLPETKVTNSIKQRSIFDADKLPIFCKIEHKLSKSSKVNLRMRLGSLDYVNKLEGKN